MESSLGLALLLIAVGFLLLLVELLLPTGGMLFILTAIAVVTGVVLAFHHDPYVGTLTLVLVFIALPIVGGVFRHLLPRTPFGKRLFLDSGGADATVSSTEEHAELEQLVGRFGRTVSSLRPSGVTNFDGRRVDTITEGMMVDPNQWVQCVAVRAGKVIVRPVDKPDIGALETADFS